jgi:hypothetical protein
MFLIGLAALAQDEGPIFTGIDPAQGPTIGENRTLSQWHPGSDDRMFPDIAVKDLRIDGDTLYVLVTNEGRKNAARVQVTARAESKGARSGAASARLPTLSAGESKWVSLGHFTVALADASVVSAAVRLPAPVALDRSGQGCDACADVNQANDSFSAAPSSIARGKPE